MLKLTFLKYISSFEKKKDKGYEGNIENKMN